VIESQELMLDISYLALMWEENSERLDWAIERFPRKLEWDIGYLTLMKEAYSGRVNWGYGMDYWIGKREDGWQRKMEYQKSRPRIADRKATSLILSN
jgi:hypothetical protein